MPSFADSIFLFVLALLLFGPKKLPVLARELGKWMGEFRRASNEFKMQMDEELRASEQADRQKKIAAMEAAAPVPPALDDPAEPEHPHLRRPRATEHPLSEAADASVSQPNLSAEGMVVEGPVVEEPVAEVPATDNTRPLPIATSGSLQMMPPETGLPTARTSRGGALSSLVEAIPESTSGTGAESAAPPAPRPEESVVHAD